MAIQVFDRKETKYLLSEAEYNILMPKLYQYLVKDVYYKSTVCNIYFDTRNNDLIIKSIEKPMYKEKIRLRSYFVPTIEDYVFLEIKKKFKGVVNKRRIKIKLQDFYNYLQFGTLNNINSQIAKEIDYCFKKYNLVPKIFLAYDRVSYFDKNNQNFRITFDTNIRSRVNDLNLEKGDYGQKYFKDNIYLMETKINGSYPLWFVKLLSEFKIYPISFSKYGEVYSSLLMEEKHV